MQCDFSAPSGTFKRNISSRWPLHSIGSYLSRSIRYNCELRLNSIRTTVRTEPSRPGSRSSAARSKIRIGYHYFLMTVITGGSLKAPVLPIDFQPILVTIRPFDCRQDKPLVTSHCHLGQLFLAVRSTPEVSPRKSAGDLETKSRSPIAFPNKRSPPFRPDTQSARWDRRP